MTQNAGPTLDYSNLRGSLLFDRIETPDGVAFSTTAPMYTNVIVAILGAIVLVFASVGMLAIGIIEKTGIYRLKPFCLGFTAVIFALALSLKGLNLWRRRNMPISVSISSDHFVVIVPHAIMHWRMTYPLSSVQSVEATGAGPMLGGSTAKPARSFRPTTESFKLQRAGSLNARIAGRRVRLLHPFPLQDLQEIARELQIRIGRSSAREETILQSPPPC